MHWVIIWAALLWIMPIRVGAEPLVVSPAEKEIMLTGYTRGDATVTLASEVPGRVIRVNYSEGETIKDKPFCEIDTTFIDFQIQGTRQKISGIEAAIAQNESRVAYLKKEYERIDQLHQGDRATGVKRDSAQEEYQQAGLARRSLAAEKGALEVALRELMERKRRHDIRAPAGWVLVARMVEPGEMVAPNIPLGRATDFQKLVIPLSVSGEELSAIQALDEPFGATVDGVPATARINRINPEFDEKTRKLGIELILVDHGGPRRGGLRFTLPVALETQGVWVPRAAVIDRYENPRVRAKGAEAPVNILILGESNGHYIVADHPDLQVGTELAAP